MIENNQNQSLSEDVFRVKSSGNIKKIAGAIINKIEETGKLEISCIGAGSLNQGIKSVIIAKSILGKKGIKIDIDLGFRDIEFDDGKIKSSIFITLRIV